MDFIINHERFEIFEILFKAGVDVNRTFEIDLSEGKLKDHTCMTRNWIGMATFEGKAKFLSKALKLTKKGIDQD